MIEKVIAFFLHHRQCVFHEITGYYCPGCGGTRASIAFLHGEFLRSFILHPVVDYTAVMCLVFIILWIKYAYDRKYRPTEKLLAITVYIAVVILVINCAVKNYFLIVRGIDLLNLK